MKQQYKFEIFFSSFSDYLYNKVDTKPQARSIFDVTSFRSEQILKNLIVGTDGPSDRQRDQQTDRPSDGRSEL
jgi:hypothetical protein